MVDSIEQFGKACNAALKAKPGPAGRTTVCAMLRELLVNAELMNKTFDENTPERKLLYEDPELGFCVLAHNYKGAKESTPHDHGPSWAIYGQVTGETKMFDWELVSPAGPETTGKVKRKKDYVLKPGIAHVYNEGDLHSPSRAGSTRLIRIEGTNMEKVKRFKFEAIDAN
jgi:hypothetical protein